ncbi:solute carrier organic anion transporter family member 2A1-like [Anneissia japonica]|uniref:solute carrier organic anion transporter family member 2A1-like n=1 Tax=Anneissia japonica TaxID=1529436 RepID=UPI0014255A06|nr:solute carrier organic anion transporter family member 2A1-like [Anneissia japonica]XP_033121666.1 solute carrier organic anion transporter family member 2A1-like [Anneissia japonica]XP_033121667.1 solute carrier organic anion transporter family member 2A1-like [Anneissia japonica]
MSATGQKLDIKYDSIPDIVDDDGVNDSQSRVHCTPSAHSLSPKNDNDDTDCFIHCCNRVSNPVAFLSVIIPLFSIYMGTLTYLGGCISTIEKQFQLSSSQSGSIATINDIVSLSLVVFVTYYGSKSHRPRLISVSIVIAGIGIFLLAVPHFTANPSVYRPTENSDLKVNHTDESDHLMTNNELCSVGDVIEDRCASGEITEEQPLNVFWLIIGQILIGIGGAPMFPLTITYLDDSTVDSTTTSIYIAGIFVAMGLGPFIGFMASFQCLSLYVDFDRVDGENIPTDPRDPRWIGAWWLGFVLAAVLIVVLSIPLFFFPRNLKKYECTCCGERSKNTEQEEEKFSIAAVYKTDFMKDKKNGILASLKGLLLALKRLLTNPTLIFLTMTVACNLAIVSGFAFFIAKYVEKQYAVSAATASIVIGGINLPGTVFSNVLSSFCVKKFNLTQFGLGRMLVAIATCSFLFSIPLLFIGCSNPGIAGVTTHYNTSFNQGQGLLPNLIYSCNSNCACPDNVYKPVCGSDGITYSSACHAGCTDVWREGMGNLDEVGLSNNETIYVGCSCITTGDEWETTDGLIEGGSGTEGSCDWTCDKLLPFALIVAVISVCASMKPNPGIMLLLRCVEPSDRALALAVGGVVIRVLGFLPAPIYFGAIISSTCLIRQELCGREGACLVYDLERYRYSFIGLFVGLKLLAAILTMCTHCSINPDRLEKNKTKALPIELLPNDSKRGSP